MRLGSVFIAAATLSAILSGQAFGQSMFERMAQDAIDRAAESERSGSSVTPGGAAAGSGSAPGGPRILSVPLQPDSVGRLPPAQAPVSPSILQPPPVRAAPPAEAVRPPERPVEVVTPGAPPPVPQASAPAAPPRSALIKETVNAVQFYPDAEADKGASALILKAQVLLDRAHSSPGVIDAIYGSNVAKAIAAYQAVLGLEVTGRLTPEVWTALGGEVSTPVLIDYTITQEDVAGPFTPEIPSDFSEMAQLERLGYRSPQEMLAERFHMDQRFLESLNAGKDFWTPGTVITVANVLDAGKPHGKVVHIEADKARRQIRAYDDKGWLIVAYPATIGSAEKPSPTGTHTVKAIAVDPVYYYDPQKNFQQGANTKKLQLPPGPNNPVGTTWIGLSQPSYGIHGTPEPSKIDKTASNGCVRLTNWDARELSALVSAGVTVTFLDPQ